MARKKKQEPLTFPTFRGGVPGWKRFQPPHDRAEQLELFGSVWFDMDDAPPPGDPAWDEVPICEDDDWCDCCGAPNVACRCVRRNPRTRRTEIIGVHVPKAKFSATMARRWVSEHGFRISKSDTTTNWYRFKQMDSVGFSRVFTKTLPNGVQLIIGVY